MSFYDSQYPRTAYYYAYLNAENICTEIVQMSTPITDPHYIRIPSNDQSLVGQYFDRALEEFKTVYYYAVLNEKDVVTETEYYLTKQTESGKRRAITYHQYLTVKGMWWNGTDYVQPPISVQAVASTDQISYKGENVWLTTVLEEMQDDTTENTAGISKLVSSTTAIGNDLVHTKADIEGSFKAVSSDIQAIGGDIQRINTNIDALAHTANDHEGAINALEDAKDGLEADVQTLSGNDRTLSDAIGTVAETASQLSQRVASLDSEMIAVGGDVATNKQRIDALEADTDERFEAYGSQMNGLEGSVSAATGRVVNLESRATALERDVSTAKSNITSLTTQVSANKTKITSLEAAQKTYLPLAGGSLEGDLDVNGVLRMNGSQAFFYNVGTKTMNIGSNNATTINLAGTHSGGTMNVNSALFRPYSVVPRNSDSLLGNATYRWKGIYSQAAVNVSSDERLRKNIEMMDSEKLAKFIRNLAVVSYQYKDEEMALDRIGLVAQQVIEADPELSRYFVTCDGDGYYSMRPADLVFPLIAAVQQLQEEIERLKKT